MPGIDLNLQIMKLLAVAGGGAVGYLLIGGILRLLGRYVFRNKLPAFVHWAVRLAGGVAGALLVWFWLAGAGGGGPGGGGGWGMFGGSGTGPGSGDAALKAKKEKLSKAGTEKRGAAMEVEMLGGPAVKEERFYKIEGEPEPVTFDEAKRRIADRLIKQPDLKVLRIVVRLESVASDHEAVKQLERWARENGLTPEVAKP